MTALTIIQRHGVDNMANLEFPIRLILAATGLTLVNGGWFGSSNENTVLSSENFHTFTADNDAVLVHFLSASYGLLLCPHSSTTPS